MSRLRRILRLVLGIAVIATGCGRRDRAPVDRPNEPTLILTPDAQEPATGRRIVTAGQIAQPWHVGLWSPASITLPAVEAGDAIVVLGMYWGDLPRDADTAPTDDHGTLRRAVDQGPSVVGRTKPPVFAQLYVELDAAPGPHTITPPYLGGPAGDGTLYVVQIRGLTEHLLVATGQTWTKGVALADLFVALGGAAQPDDLVIALGGYDNTTPIDHSGLSHPPVGWVPLGVQEDAASNVPSELCYRRAPSSDSQPVTWTWSNPTVNVATAVIAAFR